MISFFTPSFCAYFFSFRVAQLKILFSVLRANRFLEIQKKKNNWDTTTKKIIFMVGRLKSGRTKSRRALRGKVGRALLSGKKQAFC